MRREFNDQLLRSLLSFTAALREEIRDVRRLLAARNGETKYNPNWRLQPRAPRGVREGGQWVGGGGAKQTAQSPQTRTRSTPQRTPTSPQTAPQPERQERPAFPANNHTPRTANDTATWPSQRDPAARLERPPREETDIRTLPLRLFRASPILLILPLYGDTPRPEIITRLVAGTDDLVLLVVIDRGATSASFQRIIRPERRVPWRLAGIDTGLETTEPAQLERLHVDVIVEDDEVIFNRNQLVREYGREIEGITTTPSGPPLSGGPELVPVTPEEWLIDYNLRQLGASPLQIFVAISTHRYARGDEEALRSALFLQTQASFFEIDAILRATREARDEAADADYPLILDETDEIFPNLDAASPSSMIATSSATWALPSDSVVSDDNNTLAAGQQIIREIQTLNPNYQADQLERLANLPATIEARVNYIDRLRLQRAVAIYRARGDNRPLQMETLRILQLEVDRAYDAGRIELSAGRLTIYLSEEEALGNYIDRRARNRLRSIYRSVGIDWVNSADIRIQRREYDTTGTDLTYRIPDAAVGDLMFDATITRKQPGYAQIRGFFAADARPRGVIIVRPSVLGGSYFITPPENRRLRR